jgi:cation transport ATPase
MPLMVPERLLRRGLIAIALVGLILGSLSWATGRNDLAQWCWVGGTIPVLIGLLVSMVRDLLSGRMGVDSIALVSMSAAIVLGQALAGIVIAIMYAGGNLLEDIAVARAERDLKSLIDRAPRVAHRRSASIIEEISVEQVVVGDNILVKAGEIVPVDGIITSQRAIIDEAALSGEPIPVSRQAGALARSGALNAGAMHSKFALLLPPRKVHTQALSEWSLPRRPQSRPSSEWRTDMRCCYCRSQCWSQARRGFFPAMPYGD